MWECGMLAEVSGQSRSTCPNTSMNQHSHIEAFTNLVFESHWTFWDSAWDTHCRTLTVYCTIMTLEHWTNTKHIKKQWVFSLSQTCLSSLISLVIPLRSTGPIMVIILSELHKHTWWTNWTAYSLSLAFGSFPNKLSKIICLKQE